MQGAKNAFLSRQRLEVRKRFAASLPAPKVKKKICSERKWCACAFHAGLCGARVPLSATNAELQSWQRMRIGQVAPPSPTALKNQSQAKASDNPSAILRP